MALIFKEELAERVLLGSNRRHFSVVEASLC
jgi:hypothetical protein